MEKVIKEIINYLKIRDNIRVYEKEKSIKYYELRPKYQIKAVELFELISKKYELDPDYYLFSSRTDSVNEFILKEFGEINSKNFLRQYNLKKLNIK